MGNFEFLGRELCSYYSVVLTILVLLLFWIYSTNPNIWEKQGIIQVKTDLISQFILNLRKCLHEVEVERYKQYGPLYGYFIGKTPALSIADPKLVKIIMIKDFSSFTDVTTYDTGDRFMDNSVQFLHGDRWKRIRSIITPNLTSSKIRGMLEKIKVCARDLVKNFEVVAQKGEAVDIKRYFGAFTMDTITSTCFSIKVGTQEDVQNHEFLNKAYNFYHRNINWRFNFYLMFPDIYRLFKIAVMDPSASTFFGEITQKIVKIRMEGKEKYDDFLQNLMDSEESTAHSHSSTLTSHSTTNEKPVQTTKNSGKKLTFEEMVSQCVLFFLAGFETTSTCLSFVTYHMALNPHIQEKLIEEIDETLRKCDGKLTYEVVMNGLAYMENVISETLRLAPSTVRSDRVATKDYELVDPDESFKISIPKGSIVTIPANAMQMDSKFFPDPENFDPDRFLPENRSKIIPFTYLPFGEGQRSCLGKRIALFETKVCLTYLFSHFMVKRCAETKDPLDYNQGFGFLHPKSIVLRFEKRPNKPFIL